MRPSATPSAPSRYPEGMDRPPDPELGAAETRSRLERLMLLARRTRRDPTRGRRAAGQGIEPGARRPYARGDDPRHVDWQAYARLEQLLVKVPEAIPPARLVLALDASASLQHGTPRPVDRARLALAARGAAALARGVRVDALWGTQRVRLHQPSELQRLLRFLDAAPAASAAFPALTALGGSGRGELCLITDALDPAELREAAQRGRARGFSVSALVIEAPQEAPPAVRAAAADASRVQLVDAETGAQRWTTLPAQAWAAAARARTSRQRESLRTLDELGLPCARLGAEDPFEAPALKWLGRG